MKVDFVISFFLIQSIRLCYQQDIPVCGIGFEYKNGSCVPVSCPGTLVLVNGVCRQKPECSIGFEYRDGVCIKTTCPNDFVLVDGICHAKVTTSPPTTIPFLSCPYGYNLYNGLCYPVTSSCQSNPCGTQNCPNNCVQQQTTTPTIIIIPTTETTTTTTTTTPMPQPPPDEIRDCPPDSVLIDGMCRLIYCPKGTIYKGRCLQPVCRDGLVWTGHICDKPEVITTILEIENTFTTEFNETAPQFHKPDVVNNVVYHTVTEKQETSTEGKICSTTQAPLPPSNSTKQCCNVITPRMCKRYNSKWVCFNRQYKSCDHNICGNHTMVYIRVPKVIEHQDMLVVPPNPPLQVCGDDMCTTQGLVDCSGCSKNQREKCSLYCYRYRCPTNRCKFIDQYEYCTLLAGNGSPGCSRYDGCLDDWCSDYNITPTKSYKCNE